MFFVGFDILLTITMVAMDKLIIARADITEAEALTNLSITTFRDAFTEGNSQEDMDKYIADEMSPGKLTEELRDKENIFFIAWHDLMPVGYVKLRTIKVPEELKYNNPIEIERLYVLRDYQDKKIGTLIMNHCFEFAVNGKHGWEYGSIITEP